MAAKIVGGRMCGAVRYESTTDAVMQASCYCRDCQRSTGSAFAPVLLVPKEAFKLTKGELKQYEVAGDSGNKVSRGFCANCGSPIREPPVGHAVHGHQGEQPRRSESVSTDREHFRRERAEVGASFSGRADLRTQSRLIRR
jgi:hypothetical protein